MSEAQVSETHDPTTTEASTVPAWIVAGMSVAAVALVFALSAIGSRDHGGAVVARSTDQVHSGGVAGSGGSVVGGDHSRGGDRGHDHGPIASGDHPPNAATPTAAQQARADQLVNDMKAALAKYSTTASVEAAGYRSIGDRVTGFEHFVNSEFLDDDVALDPEKVESLVFKVDGTNKELVTGMFILASGKTMADVPDVGGSLTMWHDHQNLCWDDSGHVVGVLLGEKCTRGTFRPTAPMLHVWVVPNECGPFAGVEGKISAISHGSSCTHAPASGGGSSGTGAEAAGSKGS